jgi:hypothetical protein
MGLWRGLGRLLRVEYVLGDQDSIDRCITVLVQATLYTKINTVVFEDDPHCFRRRLEATSQAS